MRRTGYAKSSDNMHSTSLIDAQFPITALREIKLLKMLSHVNILRLEEMAVERPKGTSGFVGLGMSMC